MHTVNKPDDAASPNEPIGIVFPVVFLAGLSLSLFAASGTFLYQCYHWLRSGVWLPISVIDGIYMLKENRTLGIDLTWLLKPLADWQGVWKILDMIPASLLLFFAGLAVMYLAMQWGDAVDRAKKKAAENA